MADDPTIAGMIAEAEDAFGGVDILVNNAGIQHVAPIEEFPVEKWDAIIAINLSAAFHTIAACGARHEGARLGPHRQHRLGARAGRLAVQVGLRRRQARHRRPDQDRRARSRRARHHRQRDLPRLRADAAGREADPRHRQGARHHRGAGRSATCCWPRSRPSTSSPSRRWRRSRCSSAATTPASITGTLLPVDGGWTAH